MSEATVTSSKAVASLVCAILGLFILGIVLGPVAICLAIDAQNEIRDRPHQVKGECIANAGLVIGIIAFVFSIIIIIVIVS